MEINLPQSASDLSPPFGNRKILSLTLFKPITIIMKKSILLFLIAFIFCNNANCQITKGNWLVGGNATFSRLKNSSTASAQFKQTNFEIRPLLGYFLKDKFAVGLDPSLSLWK